MSERERLHAIIDALPAHQVRALLALLGPIPAFLAGAPEEPVDADTAARIDASLSEAGADISHEELWARLSKG